MPLLSFSGFVPQLLYGSKKQTTRSPRKKPLNKNDVLHVYFKSRMKKTCKNCLQDFITDVNCRDETFDDAGCSNHINKFGQAVITGINITRFCDWETDDLEKWAILDGFKSFVDADKWFTKRYGEGWFHQTWEIITFEPDWIC